MASVLLAVGAAVVWGAGDFFGGKASQRGHPLAVTVVSQLACLPVLGLAVLLLPGSTPAGSDIAWDSALGRSGFLASSCCTAVCPAAQ
jgi:hypothetical protein